METRDSLNSKRPKIKSGLFLFEVAVAVAVVSIGIVFILRSFSRTLDAVRLSQKYYQALVLLENKDWDLKCLNAKGINLDTLSAKEGEFEDNPPFHWSIDLEPLEGIDLNQLELTVSWPQNKTKQSVSVATYVHPVRD